MTTTIPSFDEYEQARHVLAHSTDFELPEVNAALTWINEFETAVRDAVAAQFRDPRRAKFMPDSIPHTVLPAWEDMSSWLREALFDAAMTGARAAQGGAR
ncbi:hypothetical protein ACXYTP_19125 [Tsukamurella ocularis]|uniref:hypothetical protein n=1 Tax=Tsukamurella ocularis TaxID=1970234 RepID=UPI0039EE219A